MDNLTTTGYCPSISENICDKHECDIEETMGLKQYLHERCNKKRMEERLENITGIRMTENRMEDVRPAPDTVLLPEHIRPESYVIWLWIMKEPKIKGNATITINVSEYEEYTTYCN